MMNTMVFWGVVLVTTAISAAVGLATGDKIPMEALDHQESAIKSTDFGKEKKVQSGTDRHEDLVEVNFTGAVPKASNSGSNFPPINAITNSFWHNNSPYEVPCSLWFEFPVPIRVVKYSFTSRFRPNDPVELTVTDGPSKYSFWGSNHYDCSQETSRVVLHEDNFGTPFKITNKPKTKRIQHKDFFRCYGFTVTDVPGRIYQDKYIKAVTIGNVHFYSEIANRKTCEDVNGTCISKKKSVKKCMGKLDKKAKCPKKRDVCCVKESCPKDFVDIPTGGCCYYYSDRSLNWTDASEYCNDLGVSIGQTVGLAEVYDDNGCCNTQEFMEAMTARGKYAWLGATNTGSTWTWQYSKVNLPISSSLWKFNEPSGLQNCLAAQISGTGKYNRAGFDDGWCDSPQEFVCQIFK